MSEVLRFKPKTDPHNAGPARCIQCGHQWSAVSPVGTAELECPKCKTMKGVFLYPTAPRADAMWRCNCGSDLFYIIPEGCQCYQCGDMWDEG